MGAQAFPIAATQCTFNPYKFSPLRVMALRVLRALACAAGVAAAPVKVGDTLPDNSDLAFHLGFPPEKVSLRKLCKGRTIVVVGLPGAFTPT